MPSDLLSNTFVIIPMLNEADSIQHVLSDLPPVRQVIVVDNGSTDGSPEIATRNGAQVVAEPQRGYGKACLTGIETVRAQIERDPDTSSEQSIVAFVDGDYSDHPEELRLLLDALNDGNDFVVGSRSRGAREEGAMPFQAIFGNWLACTLMWLFWRARYTDLGPFRVIRYPALKSLRMTDENFGWTIEMQIKAVQRGLRYCEIPVSYRRRIGTSKISGTISGTLRAGYKILYTIFRYRVAPPA